MLVYKDKIGVAKEYNSCVENCQEDLRSTRFLIEF